MGKKILITGGAGFIAHHVIDKILSTTDWEIITLDRLDFSGNLNRLNEVVSSYPEIERKRVRVIHHDLKAELNPEIIATIGDIDLISHLAAGSHVDRSITYPLEFVMDKKNLSLKTHSFKTLPKAQRTRGLSSSCQSHIASSNTNLDRISSSES